ncbi:MAG: glycosyltransferase family 39 protein [Aggregatilineales bacterium]
MSGLEKLPRLDVTALLLVVLLAFGVRIHQLGAQSLWNDEGNSYVQAGRAFDEIAAHAARDIHPPLYYWLLKAWTGLAGTTEFALRALSVFASALTVAFAAAAGQRLFNRETAAAAGLFAALNSFSVYYAQETRMYALLALWAAAALWSFAGFLRAPAWRRGLILAGFNTAGLWTHYAYPFVMLAQGGAFVLASLFGLGRTASAADAPAERLAGRWRVFIAANLLTIGLFLPWLPTAWGQITTWPSTGQPAPFVEALGTIVGWLTLGSAYTAVDSSWVAVALILMALGLRAVHGRSTETGAVLAVVIWTALPAAALLALALYREANLKFLLPAQVGCALWIARGAAALWALETGSTLPLARALPRAAATLAALGLAATMWSALRPLYDSPAFQRADYRAIAASIAAAGGPDDAVILDAPNQEEVFRYYYKGNLPVYPLPAGLGGNDEATRQAVRQVIGAHAQVFAVFWGEAERDPNRAVETTLNAHAYEADSRWYGDVRLVRYIAPTELPISQAANVRFGDHIALVSYALSGTAVPRGGALQVRLDWIADAPLETRYKVTVQLLNADGALVAQRDSEPGGGLALTTTWRPGEPITDRHALIIPDSLTPAQYALIIGLYDINDPQIRLLANGRDHLEIAQITVR